MADIYKNKLRDYINQSNLSVAEKELWGLYMRISLPDEDEAIYEAVSESKESLILMTRHLRDKIRDMKQDNISVWKKIIAANSKYAQLQI